MENKDKGKTIKRVQWKTKQNKKLHNNFYGFFKKNKEKEVNYPYRQQNIIS